MRRCWAMVMLASLIPMLAAVAEADDTASLYAQLTRNVVLIREHQSICTPGRTQAIQRDIALGTGFLVLRDLAGDKSTWLVTARHVVEKHADLFAQVRASLNPDRDGYLVLPRERWVFHPESAPPGFLPIDVAVVRVSTPATSIAFRYCVGECSTTPESSEHVENNVTTGPEPTNHVIFFGYPEGDVAQNEVRPFVRSGMVAYSAPNPGLLIDGKSVFDQTMFYVDAPSFPGNSGGPVMREPTPFSGPILLWGLVTGGSFAGRDYAIVTSVERIKQTIEHAALQKGAHIDGWSTRSPKLSSECSK